MNVIKKLIQKAGFLNENLFEIDKTNNYNNMINTTIETNNSIDHINLINMDNKSNINPDIRQYFDKKNLDSFEKLEDLKSKLNIIFSKIVPFYNIPFNNLFKDSGIPSSTIYINKNKYLYQLSSEVRENKFMINKKMNLKVVENENIDNYQVISKEIIPLGNINDCENLKHIFLSMVYSDNIISSFINMVEIKDGIVVLKENIKENNHIKAHCDLFFQNLLYFKVLDNGTIDINPTKSLNNILKIFILTGNIDAIYNIFCAGGGYYNELVINETSDLLINDDIKSKTKTIDFDVHIMDNPINIIKKLKELLKEKIYNKTKSVLYNINTIYDIIYNKIKINIINDDIDNMVKDINKMNKFGINNYNDIVNIKTNIKFKEYKDTLNKKIEEIKKQKETDTGLLYEMIKKMIVLSEYKQLIDRFKILISKKDEEAKGSKSKKPKKEPVLVKSPEDTIFDTIKQNIDIFKKTVSNQDNTIELSILFKQIDDAPNEIKKIQTILLKLDPKKDNIFIIIDNDIKNLRKKLDDLDKFEINYKERDIKKKDFKLSSDSSELAYDDPYSILEKLSIMKINIKEKIEKLSTMSFNDIIKNKKFKFNNKKEAMAKKKDIVQLLIKLIYIVEHFKILKQSDILDLIYYYNFYYIFEFSYKIINRHDTEVTNDITHLNTIINTIKEHIYIDLIFEILKLFNITYTSYTNDDFLTLHILDVFIASTLKILRTTEYFNINIITHYNKENRTPISDKSLNKFFYSSNFYLMGPHRMNPSANFKSSSYASDCGELTLFNLINYLIFNNVTNKLDSTMLPPNTRPELISLYNEYNTVSSMDLNIQKFYNILHDLTFNYVASGPNIDNRIYNDIYDQNYNKVEYTSLLPTQKYIGFDMRPNYITFVRVLNRLLGSDDLDVNTINTDTLHTIIDTFKIQLDTYHYTSNIEHNYPTSIIDIKKNTQDKNLEIFLSYGHAYIINTKDFSESAIKLSNIQNKLSRFFPTMRRNAYIQIDPDISIYNKACIMKLYLVNYMELFSDICYLNTLYFLIKLLKETIEENKDNYTDSMYLDKINEHGKLAGQKNPTRRGSFMSSFTNNEFYELYKSILNFYADNIKLHIDLYEYTTYINDRRRVIDFDINIYFKSDYLKYFIDRFNFSQVRTGGIIYKISGIKKLDNKSLGYFVIIFKDQLDFYIHYYPRQIFHGLQEIIRKIFLYKKNNNESFNEYFNKIYNTSYNNHELKLFYNDIITKYYNLFDRFNIEKHHFESSKFNYSNIEYITLLLNSTYIDNISLVSKHIFTQKNTIFELKNLTGYDLIQYLENHLIGRFISSSPSLSELKYRDQITGKFNYTKMFGSAKQVVWFIVQFKSVSVKEDLNERFVENFNTFFETEYTFDSLIKLYNTIYPMYEKIFYQECIEILTNRNQSKYLIKTNKEIKKGITYINMNYKFTIYTNNNMDTISKKFKKLFFDDKFIVFYNDKTMNKYNKIKQDENTMVMKHIVLDIVSRVSPRDDMVLTATQIT